MDLLDLKAWIVAAALVSGCSDDGVPAAADTDGSAPATSGDADSASAGASSSAVTTADTGGDTSDPSGSTGPTDPTEGGGVTDGESGAGSTGEGSDGSTGESGSDESGTGGGSTESECLVDDDCMLVNDCCSCEAIPVGDEPPKCDDDLNCLISTCESLSLGPLPAVQCNFGTCEIEAVSCDPLEVTCDEEMKKCPEGQAPRVVEGCWGACIPVEYCDVVPGCDDCTADEACVESFTQLGASFSCVPVAAECDGVPSCECLGEACEAPFDACSDGAMPKSGSELQCSCPTCS